MVKIIKYTSWSFVVCCCVCLVSISESRAFNRENNRFGSFSKWKTKKDVEREKFRNELERQDPVFPILDPSTVVDGAAAANSYLPDLGFWTDLGQLFLGRSPALSPFVSLSRNLFESQKCAEYVSCQVAKMSRDYSPFKIMHNFLTDLPFKGDLAERVVRGSKFVQGSCPFQCNPMAYLNRGVRTLTLLHSVVEAATAL